VTRSHTVSASREEVTKALRWVDSIRDTEDGFSENEKKLIVLADEVLRLRKLWKKGGKP
jgi:hypothetical protein